MTQIDLLPECRVPPKGTQCYTLLQALKEGVRLTVKKALDSYGVYALSQRMGDLRNKYHWPIKDRFVETPGGAVVKEYWL